VPDRPAVDAVRAVVRRAFPDAEVASVTPIPRGNRKQTVLVSFDDRPDVVVQCSSRPAALRTEVAVARAVRRRTGVPVPRVLAAGECDGLGYAVVELARGADLHERFVGLSDERRRTVAETFGGYLAELHEAFAFDAYGAVVASEGEQSALAGDASADDAADGDGKSFRVVGTRDWSGWFRSHAREGIDALPAAFDGLVDDLRAAVEEAALPERPPSRLYPWDFRPGNALYADRRVTAVLDWGEPLAAAPGLAAAKAEYLVADWYVPENPPLRAAFREGYVSVRPYPDVPRVYRLAAVIRSAVDSAGVVTRPRYPEVDGDPALAFHREQLARWL
jgi:Ser/Thr protein kinase RdoA (MazF antagonist)